MEQTGASGVLNGFITRDDFRLFPTMRGYRRRWLGRDVLAGVTFGAVTIPGQIATAHLAGMPATAGLYGFLAACFCAAAISTNRHLALGMDSTVAPMLAIGLAGLGLAEQSQQYIAFAVLTTMLVGLMVLFVGVGKMGWVGALLSKPVVTGFLGGIAVIIVVDQIPGLLGLPGGGTRTLERIVIIFQQLGEINWITTAIGVTSLALLLGIARFNRRIPGALIVLVLAITVVTAFDLTADGVAVLGSLSAGLPPIALPELNLDRVEQVLATAVAITLICLAQTAATTRSSAAIGGFDTDINADFRAMGSANVLSSLLGSFTADASPPSTTIIAESRGRTQLVSLVGGVLAIGFLVASSLAQNLPIATLSAVLIYIAIKIFRVDEMRATRRYSWRAFTLMLITLFGVVSLGIATGVALAVLISFGDRARRTARPELLQLGRLPDSQWLPIMDSRVEPPDGVIAFRLNGPLWFANATWFRQELIAAIPEGPDKPDLLVLDTTRMDDIDFTGADALIEIAEICELRGVMFALAAHVGRSEEEFRKGGLMNELGEERFFDSVEVAYNTLLPVK